MGFHHNIDINNTSKVNAFNLDLSHLRQKNAIEDSTNLEKKDSALHKAFIRGGEVYLKSIDTTF